VYLEYYGLLREPFGTAPDPAFLFSGPQYREALAQLQYGVQGRKGFVVLTGEAGTGKTTLLRTLMERFDASTACAYVFNPSLPFDGLLEFLVQDLGVEQAGSTRTQRLMALNAFLTTRRRAGQNTVLMIDEAQTLDPETLEQVRLLSNFETSTEKLLQILLVGQPELREMLQRPDLRQLKQRVGLRCSISPLTPDEVSAYIETRLRVAGVPDPDLFSEDAVALIADYSGGIPRTVNVLCDHCLLIGYTDQECEIDRAIAEDAIVYMEEGEPPVRRTWSLGGRRGRPVRRLGLAVAATLAVAAALFLMKDDSPGTARVLASVADAVRVAADLGRWAWGQLWP
jgi:general secretion pathway protein A